VKGVHGEKLRIPDLSQQPVLGIKKIPRTGSCEPVGIGRIPSLAVRRKISVVKFFFFTKE